MPQLTSQWPLSIGSTCPCARAKRSPAPPSAWSRRNVAVPAGRARAPLAGSSGQAPPPLSNSSRLPLPTRRAECWRQKPPRGSPTMRSGGAVPAAVQSASARVRGGPRRGGRRARGLGGLDAQAVPDGGAGRGAARAIELLVVSSTGMPRRAAKRARPRGLATRPAETRRRSRVRVGLAGSPRRTV